MFWDNVAGVYDIFTNIINKKTHKGLCERIGELIFETEEVLECACGTGLLSGIIGKKCKKLVATDFSAKMYSIKTILSQISFSFRLRHG